MTIIVPCAGIGQRFIDAGYADPKPLVHLDDPSGGQRRILEHVVGMFDPSERFIFICNEKHIDQTKIEAEILALCPNATILAMPCHKRGPVYTVKAAFDQIPDERSVIVAYCDGAIRWNQRAFMEHVGAELLDGCILTHTGFHPHVLGSTRMAFVREEDGRVLEVKEKESFTDEPQREHASSGVYYFRTGRMLKHYFDRALTEGVNYNGECYVTLVYNQMIADGLRVGLYDTPVAILGTPAEVSNYSAWATILRGEQCRSEADAVKCYRFWKKYHAASVGQTPDAKPSGTLSADLSSLPAG